MGGEELSEKAGEGALPLEGCGGYPFICCRTGGTLLIISGAAVCALSMGAGCDATFWERPPGGAAPKIDEYAASLWLFDACPYKGCLL